MRNCKAMNISVILAVIVSSFLSMHILPTNASDSRQNYISQTEDDTKNIQINMVCLQNGVFCSDNKEIQCLNGKIYSEKSCNEDGQTCVNYLGCVTTQLPSILSNTPEHILGKANYVRHEARIVSTCNTPGISACDGTLLMYCNGYVWVHIMDCADDGYKCSDGKCVPALVSSTTEKPSTTVCEPSDMICFGSWVLICNGYSWIYVTDCSELGLVCELGKCEPNTTPTVTTPLQTTTQPGCEAGSIKCSGSYILLCYSGAWVIIKDCFEDGLTCSGGICAISTEYPTTTTQTIITSTTTEYQTTTVQEPCEFGDVKCSGTMVAFCTDGEWYYVQDCSENGMECSEGVCLSTTTPPSTNLTCEFGEFKCSGSWIVLCNGFTWNDLLDCSWNGKVCYEGECVLVISTINPTPTSTSVISTTSHETTTKANVSCMFGELQCFGTFVAFCIHDEWLYVQDCSDNGLICSNGQCMLPSTTTYPPNTCYYGELKCMGTWIAYCNGGVWINIEDCSDNGMVCSDGTCVSTTVKPTSTSPTTNVPCKYGELNCHGTWIMFCNGGEFVHVLDCSHNGLTCSEGSCVSTTEKPISTTQSNNVTCAFGEYKCSGTWVEFCISGEWAHILDCSENEMACFQGKCIYTTSTPLETTTHSDLCEIGSSTCHGTSISFCYSGMWIDIKDCASEGMMCSVGTCLPVETNEDVDSCKEPGLWPVPGDNCIFLLCKEDLTYEYVSTPCKDGYHYDVNQKKCVLGGCN